jgi:molybdenum cofactor cytidylyltransferase
VLAAGDARGPGAPLSGPLHVDEPRIRHAVRAALEAGLWPVVVVVGDPVDEVRAALAGLPVATVANEAFTAGHAGSLRLGLSRVAECAPASRGVVVVACDGRVDAAHLCALAEAARRQAGALAASSQEGRVGLPAFFAARLFRELAALAEHESCADFLARHAAELVEVASGAPGPLRP